MSASKLGKQPDDIFAPTSKRGTAVTVTLDDDDVAFIDGLAEDVRRAKGMTPDRAEVISKMIGIVRRRQLLGKK